MAAIRPHLFGSPTCRAVRAFAAVLIALAMVAVLAGAAPPALGREERDGSSRLAAAGTAGDRVFQGARQGQPRVYAAQAAVLLPLLFRELRIDELPITTVVPATPSTTSIPASATPNATPTALPTIEPSASPTASATEEPTEAPSATTTATGEATTTPTPTGKPGQEVIFFDDFSDPNSGWGVYDANTWRSRYDGGEYEILIRLEDVIHSQGAPRMLCNPCAVEVTGRFLSNREGDHGFMVVPEDPSRGEWVFLVGNDSRVSIFWREPLVGWDRILLRPSSPHVKRGTQPNRLRLNHRGAVNEFYANDQLLGQINDRRLDGPLFVGLAAQTGRATDVTVRFDDFRITAIDPP